MIGAIVANSNKLIKIGWLSQMVKSDNDTVKFIGSDQLDTEEYDFLIQNGLKKIDREDAAIYEKIEYIHKTQNKPILIRELPVIRQISSGSYDKNTTDDEKWVRLSWNSFYNDEGLHPYDPTYNRWKRLSKKYNIVMHDWQRRGDAILFNLQRDKDSSLNRLLYNGIDYKKYCRRVIKRIRNVSDRPIIIRCHPRDRSTFFYLKEKFPKLTFSNKTPLHEDLNKAWCMVTYNSTSCVESVLYGTPTITLDPSAVAWPVSWHSVDGIEKKYYPDRTEWCKRIAFMQWKGSELQDGYVWSLLKSLIQPNMHI